MKIDEINKDLLLKYCKILTIKESYEVLDVLNIKIYNNVLYYNMKIKYYTSNTPEITIIQYINESLHKKFEQIINN
jgi:hypothetical protein